MVGWLIVSIWYYQTTAAQQGLFLSLSLSLTINPILNPTSKTLPLIYPSKPPPNKSHQRPHSRLNPINNPNPPPALLPLHLDTRPPNNPLHPRRPHTPQTHHPHIPSPHKPLRSLSHAPLDLRSWRIMRFRRVQACALHARKPRASGPETLSISVLIPEHGIPYTAAVRNPSRAFPVETIPNLSSEEGGNCSEAATLGSEIRSTGFRVCCWFGAGTSG